MSELSPDQLKDALNQYGLGELAEKIGCDDNCTMEDFKDKCKEEVKNSGPNAEECKEVDGVVEASTEGSRTAAWKDLKKWLDKNKKKKGPKHHDDDEDEEDDDDKDEDDEDKDEEDEDDEDKASPIGLAQQGEIMGSASRVTFVRPPSSLSLPTTTKGTS